MRIGFHERPHDLFVVGGTCLAALVVVAAGSGPLRFTLALLLVLFLPGYVITTTVFPRRGAMDWIERIAMSIGLSLAVVPLLGLVLSGTPAGVRIEGVVGSLLLVTLGLSVVAYEQRMVLPPEDRLSLSLDIELPRWGDLPTMDRALALGVAAALVLGAGGIAYAIANPPPAVGFTEFYLLDQYGGVAPDAYPYRLNASQEGKVILGVANHERRDMTYSVQVRLVTVQYVYNASTKRNDTLENGSVDLSVFSVNLSEGGRWEERYSFSIPDPGDYQVRFFLFIPPVQTQPSRFVQLPVHVS